MVVPEKNPLPKDLIAPDERVLWKGGPDTAGTFRTQIFWWWIALPLIAAAIAANYLEIIPGAAATPLIGIGMALLAAPFLLVVQAYGTIYAITDRAAIIHHDAIGKKQTIRVALQNMDDKFELLETGRETSHLYFASGFRSKVSYADHTGKLAFRELRDAEKVAALLENAREEWKKKK